ncbi:hypothetical protein CNR22_00745 [Sphingobacteriaceae bacterium]|nr:hypothetical protein CNR22_00745 [Sphingobacteriaceae bacterium]
MTHTSYPKGPDSVPANLTVPAKSYKQHVWLASAVLLLFILFYISLSGWFFYTSIKLFANVFTGGKDGFLSFVVAVLLGFLGVFMFKALFFIIKKNKSNDIEIKKEDEPDLFEFIYKVADDARAPRPHKIFLSNVVNASVFYDISIINLIFPSKKNLEIGLGLVNTLNLGEFKSILAHEFGHFTQRSMIIGRWVYIAHQVAYQIISKRDALDDFLNRLSGVDFRLAWIGWLLNIVIWSIRSFSEFFFKLVLITQRALSREMEFHADLVAVSLTGSDALINSLYKLNSADQAYEEAITFVNLQLKKKKKVTDIYALQANAIEKMAVVLNNSDYGLSPRIPLEGAASFRIFKEQMAQTPKMWMTHPPSIEREHNAKKTYIPAFIDERSSWILFKDPEETKRKLTSELLKHIDEKMALLSKEESLALQNKEFQRSFLLPKYRGMYLNRPLFIVHKSFSEIINQNFNPYTRVEDFENLYPEHLQTELSTLKDLEDELQMLEGLKHKKLHTNDGKIKYRGRELSHKDLPGAIEIVKEEVRVQKGKIEEHDARVRNLHYSAAKKIGKGWDLYLLSLTKLIHYCEHSQKLVEKSAEHFYQVLAIMTSGGKVSSSEMDDLLRAANDLHDALKSPFEKAAAIKLNEELLARLDGEDFVSQLGVFELNSANNANINNWIDVAGSWIELVLKVLTTIREAALDELLLSEEYVEMTFRLSSNQVKESPLPLVLPDFYYAYTTDSEKPLPKRTGFFARFQSGAGPWFTAARITVAASIIIAAVILATGLGSSTMVSYNGLPVAVIVHAGDRSVIVDPASAAELEIDPSTEFRVTALTLNEDTIESFTPELADYSRTYVYNIGQAAVIFTWKAIYGNRFDNANSHETILGAPRWVGMDMDDYFSDPPESVKVKAGETVTRDVVTAYKFHPAQIASLVSNIEERENFIRSHALWEDENSTTLVSSLMLTADLADRSEICKKRLKRNPYEVATLRLQQDMGTTEEKQQACAAQRLMFEKDPSNPDLYYLACRCFGNESRTDSAFLAGNIRWPENIWLAYGAGYCYSQKEDWEKTIKCYSKVYEKSPYMREAVEADMKRIYNLLPAHSSFIKYTDLHTPYLDYVLSIAGSTLPASGSFFAFHLLAEGKIEEALQHCSQDSAVYTEILAQAAVSDGVKEGRRNEALMMNTQKRLYPNILIPALALAVQKRQSLTNYQESINEFYGPCAKAFYQFVEFTKDKKVSEADKLLFTMTAEMKARTCLLGILMLRENAPERWRILVSKLLFMNEKPYLDRAVLN